jgi:hypothetical protein
MSSNHAENQVLHTHVGLVVHVSDTAFQDERYQYTGKWCEPGEWWTFSRHGGGFKEYLCGIPYWVIKEDMLGHPLYDPRYATRERNQY